MPQTDMAAAGSKLPNLPCSEASRYPMKSAHAQTPGQANPAAAVKAVTSQTAWNAAKLMAVVLVIRRPESGAISAIRLRPD